MAHCDICRKEFKSNAGLGAHNYQKHGVKRSLDTVEVPVMPEAVSQVAPAISPTKASSAGKGRVRFTSPRSPELGVVVVPIEWMVMQVPGGTKAMQTKGKRVDFKNGVYETDDPEIINYLENVYKDDRWPIFSQSKLSRLAGV